MIWLAALVIIAFGWFLLVKRRHHTRSHYVQERSQAHEAALAAFQDWLGQPDILKAAYRAGTLSEAGLARLRGSLVGAVTEKQVLLLMSAFLQSRDVRAVIAKHMTKYRGSNKAVAMRQLMSIAEMGRKVA